MTTVFISYRREDTAGEARALFNALVARLGESSVFMDVDNIALGRDFRQVLQERLASCDLVLALIGRDWVGAKDAAGERRLDDTRDFVRLEIETALKRNIAVTPVLVQGARMPAAHQLPESIKDFAYRNGFELSHNRWESDVREMLRRLDLGEEDPERVTGPRAGVLGRLSSYLPDLISLVTGPKSAIVRWTGSQKSDLRRALLFVTVSVAIGFLLQLPRLGKEHDFATLVASMTVFKVLALVSFAGIIHLLFRMVGGRARFAETFAAYLYIVSPLYLVLVIMEIAALGVLSAYDPALGTAAQLNPGQVITDAERMRTFAAAAPGLATAYALLTYGVIAVILGWFVACWGALRDLHAVARWRSALAGIATLVSGAIFFSGLNYVLLGMFGTYAPPLH
ncbi:MAG TPA: toll/interleukin-1 receptor domain-containing protein [Burkholderiales bacterium]|nr:toll/interleukin-1 receptor domain-containing protein [Burkholderiales bacterium]